MSRRRSNSTESMGGYKGAETSPPGSVDFAPAIMDYVRPMKVAVNIRPLLVHEIALGCRECASGTPNEPQVQVPDRAFTFDHVYGLGGAPVEGLFDDCVNPLVDGLFHGYNATVLAYGQTGSGKTYTMGTGFGADRQLDRGITPRVMEVLFRRVEEFRDRAIIQLRVSLIEIHREEIRDLLDLSQSGSPASSNNGLASAGKRILDSPTSRWGPREKPAITIRETPGGPTLMGATEQVVHSQQEMLSYLEHGLLFRATGSHKMNARSSRSHAIFTIYVEQRQVWDAASSQTPNQVSERGGVANLCAKMQLVDLAGSERVKRTKSEGLRLQEGIHINKGLLALGNVISALGDERRRQLGGHIPYRDSKLTRLLQDSLGGNSRTVMIACISPADVNLEETLNTLKYANRARNIENKPMVNHLEDVTAGEIRRLRYQLDCLRAELAKAPQGPQERVVEGQLKALKDQVAWLEANNEQLRQALAAAQEQEAQRASMSHALQTVRAELQQELSLREVVGAAEMRVAQVQARAADLQNLVVEEREARKREVDHFRSAEADLLGALLEARQQLLEAREDTAWEGTNQLRRAGLTRSRRSLAEQDDDLAWEHQHELAESDLEWRTQLTTENMRLVEELQEVQQDHEMALQRLQLQDEETNNAREEAAMANMELVNLREFAKKETARAQDAEARAVLLKQELEMAQEMLRQTVQAAEAAEARAKVVEDKLQAELATMLTTRRSWNEDLRAAAETIRQEVAEHNRQEIEQLQSSLASSQEEAARLRSSGAQVLKAGTAHIKADIALLSLDLVQLRQDLAAANVSMEAESARAAAADEATAQIKAELAATQDELEMEREKNQETYVLGERSSLTEDMHMVDYVNSDQVSISGRSCSRMSSDSQSVGSESVEAELLQVANEELQMYLNVSRAQVEETDLKLSAADVYSAEGCEAEWDRQSWPQGDGFAEVAPPDVSSPKQKGIRADGASGGKEVPASPVSPLDVPPSPQMPARARQGSHQLSQTAHRLGEVEIVESEISENLSELRSVGSTSPSYGPRGTSGRLGSPLPLISAYPVKTVATRSTFSLRSRVWGSLALGLHGSMAEMEAVPSSAPGIGRFQESPEREANARERLAWEPYVFSRTSRTQGKKKKFSTFSTRSGDRASPAV